MTASRPWTAADLPSPVAPRLGRDLHAEDLAERYRRMRERKAVESPTTGAGMFRRGKQLEMMA